MLLYGGAVLLLLTAFYYLRPFDRLITQFTRLPATEKRFTPAGPEHSMPPGDHKPPPDDGGRPAPPPDHGYAPERPPMHATPNSPQQQRPFFDLVSMVLYLLVIILSWGIKITENWKSATEREARAEAAKAGAELSFLKAQINPHFLFNTLNNIYALTIKTSPDAAAAIVKLAKMMRYITQEAHREFVPLQNELECIADYIALQQLRLGQKTTVSYTADVAFPDRLIAPLLMIPFIENAFKYGVSKQEASVIAIQVSEENNMLQFKCSNSIFQNLHPEEGTGIGIANTQQRLNRLYAGQYTLQIDDANNFFTVLLTLPLQ
jgi:hypothetical protein